MSYHSYGKASLYELRFGLRHEQFCRNTLGTAVLVFFVMSDVLHNVYKR